MHPLVKITTVSIVLCPAQNKMKLSTLAIGRYLPAQDLDKGIISLRSNYANARNDENMRTFYNKVALRIHSECSNRLLSVNVFATGAIQIAGIKDSRREITQLKEKICEILNSCTGIVPPEEIVRHPVYGFFIHKDVIYGRPLSSEETPLPQNILFPIGVFRRYEGVDYVYLHDVEMKIVCEGSAQVFFTPLHRRRKNPITGRFDYLGRRIEDGKCTSDDGIRKININDFEYHYSAYNAPISSSLWTHKISLMNAGFHLGGRLNLAELSTSLRSLGFFVSYDPNIYRDINAKFMKDSTSIGTALITSTGYTRLYGFKSRHAIKKAAIDLIAASAAFILGR